MTNVLTYGLLLLLTACGAGSGEGTGDARDGQEDALPCAPDVVAGEDAPRTTPEGPPPYNDDQAILDYCTQVLLQCPPVSLSTVPGGWQLVQITDSGCTTWAPPGWVTAVDGPSLEITPDAAGAAGYFVLATYVEGVDWDEASLADALFLELKQEYPDIQVLKEETLTDPFGMGLKIRVVSVKFRLSGVETVGVYRVVHYECSPILNACPLTATGTWVPLAQVPAMACTLAQIDAALRCPSGGPTECSEGECDTTCKAMGFAGGTCVGDDCTCS